MVKNLSIHIYFDIFLFEFYVIIYIPFFIQLSKIVFFFIFSLLNNPKVYGCAYELWIRTYVFIHTEKERKKTNWGWHWKVQIGIWLIILSPCFTWCLLGSYAFNFCLLSESWAHQIWSFLRSKIKESKCPSYSTQTKSHKLLQYTILFLGSIWQYS